MSDENIKYVQTIFNNDEPNLEKFSGCGGRSYVTSTSNSIDTFSGSSLASSQEAVHS